MMKRTLIAFCSLLFGTLAAQTSCPSTMVLYYGDYCPHSMNVIGYINKQKIDIEKRDVSDPTAKEELRSLGGPMQVPCLVIDGSPLYDDELIIDWLKNHKSCFTGPTTKR